MGFRTRMRRLGGHFEKEQKQRGTDRKTDRALQDVEVSAVAPNARRVNLAGSHR